MTVERRKFTVEFKKAALERLENGKETVMQVAKDLGVDDSMIYNWRHKFEAKRLKAKAPTKAAPGAKVKANGQTPPTRYVEAAHYLEESLPLINNRRAALLVELALVTLGGL